MRAPTPAARCHCRDDSAATVNETAAAFAPNSRSEPQVATFGCVGACGQAVRIRRWGVLMECQRPLESGDGTTSRTPTARSRAARATASTVPSGRGLSRRSPIWPVSVLLSIRVLSSSCLLRLSLSFPFRSHTHLSLLLSSSSLDVLSLISVLYCVSVQWRPLGMGCQEGADMRNSKCTTVHPCVVFLMSPLPSISPSLFPFSISDPTLTLVSPPPPPPLSMSSPSSVFHSAKQFNGDLSAWDVGRVTLMRESECTTVHPCVVFLMSPPSLSLSFPFLIPHSHSSLLPPSLTLSLSLPPSIISVL